MLDASANAVPLKHSGAGPDSAGEGSRILEQRARKDRCPPLQATDATSPLLGRGEGFEQPVERPVVFDQPKVLGRRQRLQAGVRDPRPDVLSGVR